MITQFPFEYRRLGDFTYHVLTDPDHIKAYVMIWIMREWESDHKQAPDEHKKSLSDNRYGFCCTVYRPSRLCGSHNA